MKAQLDRFRRRYGVAAVGAAIVDLDHPPDTTIVADVVGHVRRGDHEPVHVADAWHIGSCAKALTAALYARLVEQGRAEWSVPLPELFDDLGGSSHAGWSTVTIDDLFTCRGGVPPNPTPREMHAAYTDSRASIDQRTSAAAAVFARPPTNPGQFLYSNLGYTIAGAAIDRITGRPFETILFDELLEPLGVTTAGFGPPPRVWGHRARAGVRGLLVGRGPAQDPGDVHSDNPALITPAGRLHLALADWARVQRLFLDGAGLLGPSSLDHLVELPADGRGMAMGWADASRVAGFALGMQGSNTAWSASALMSDDRRRIVHVVANDGRTRVLQATARLAAAVTTSPA
jgi:CubicO group peptidase (beta-lactamase class C family)